MGLTRIIPAEEISEAVDWDVAAMPVIGKEESLVRPVAAEKDHPPGVIDSQPVVNEGEDWTASQNKLLAEALLKAKEEGFSQGRKSGFSVGKKDGLQAAEAEISKIKATLAEEKQALAASRQKVDASGNQLIQVLQNLLAPLQTLDNQVEGEMLELVLLIAKRVVFHELSLNPQAIREVIQRSLSLMPIMEDTLHVRLHPDDAVLLDKDLLATPDQLWKIVEDAAISRGGCQLDTRHSHLDATVEKRIADVMQAVLGEDQS